ncbi:hypothetical protein, partial [Marivirga sp.]|uniref:hypothetical protein n=1 Tax=Marivirga sp. TaxID=2018662 RepID=UPI0025ECF8FF
MHCYIFTEENKRFLILNNLSSTLICKFRFSYNSIDKASLRRYSGLYRGKITQYIGLYGKAFP